MLFFLITLFVSSFAHAEVPEICREAYADSGAIPGTEGCYVAAITASTGLDNYWCTASRADVYATEYCGLPDYEEEPSDPCSNPVPGNPVISPNGIADFVFAPGTEFVPNRVLQRWEVVSAGLTATNLVSSAEQAQETGDSGLFFQNLYNLVLPLFPGDNALSQAFQNFSDLADTRPGENAPDCLPTASGSGRGCTTISPNAKLDPSLLFMGLISLCHAGRHTRKRQKLLDAARHSPRLKARGFHHPRQRH